MSLLTNLFRLIPPSFRAGYCPASLQQFANDLINGTQVTFLIQSGNFFYNYGSTTPLPENRIYPWLHLPSGLWYTFQFGLWTSPMDPSSREPTFRKMWKPDAGTPESALWALDGGDGVDPSITAPTSTTGAMWEVDHDFDGRFPIGIGLVPGSDPAVTTVAADTGGAAQVMQSADQLIPHQHIVPACANVTNTTDPAPTGSPVTVQYGIGKTQGTGEVVDDSASQYERAFPLTSETPDTDNVTQTPLPTLPPYRAIYWIKPTIRQYRTLPA